MSQQPQPEPHQRLNIEGASIQKAQIAQAGYDLHQIQYLTVHESFSLASLVNRRQVKPPSQQEEYRFRKVLLNKVKQYWVKGVLEKSLHTEALIELGLEERLDAVEYPFGSVQEIPNESRQTLSEGKNISDVFNQMGEGRTLLILGEPGAGKTITLLKLAQDLIARTEEDLSQPIPVVLNLSSWASSKRQTIADWLIKELSSTYKLSQALGKAWIKDQQLLLLLDGLDEVKVDRRSACVQAINQFMQEHGLTEIVVCSRIRDYEALSARLQLRGAICIQSLTSEQVNQYLDRAGDQLEAVKTLLQEDSSLQELAKSPLTLSIMTLTYQGKKVEELPQTGSSVEERRQHLLNAYIERMFSRSSGQQYPQAQAQLWLIWLAQRMSQASQTVFLIEGLQPSWLQTKEQRILYHLGNGLIGGLVLGGPFFWLIGILIAIQVEIKTVETLKWSGLIWGIFGLRGSEIQKTEPNQGIWKSALNAGILGLILGLISELILGFFVLISGTQIGLISMLEPGRIFGLTGVGVGGGTACIKHFTLRFILYSKSYIPWNYTRFLDYATERIFLQKVGGGYIFIHRMLLEHFAQMEIVPHQATPVRSP